ncbi:MAG: shikimate dehydrogenase [Lachnospiraceae bacterium]|nr:shikimate dehydrogenase [Lachnospiraceae bacterium]
MFNFRNELTGAFGMPIDENPSPVMYEAGYRSCGLNWRYQLFEVDPADLECAIRSVRTLKIAGVNLTIPHKTEAMKYMDELSESAQMIGAINTIINHNGRLIGDNTDGKGFVIGMERRGADLQGKTIVMLGAGGAARAIGVECALKGCKKIVIINRTEQKGRELAGLIQAKTGVDAEYLSWDAGVHIPACDILVNATNIGLYPDRNKPDICYDDIRPGMIVQDIIPNPAQTEFLKEAGKRQAVTYDGLNMLVYQGALAVEKWTGRHPRTEDMLAALAKCQENTEV